MSHAPHHAVLRLKNKVYLIHPHFQLVHEIESELGSLAALQHSFVQKEWRITDLVTLTQMMLQSAGETVDYRELGDLMLKEGLDHYLTAAASFFRLTLPAAED